MIALVRGEGRDVDAPTDFFIMNIRDPEKNALSCELSIGGREGENGYS